MMMRKVICFSFFILNHNLFSQILGKPVVPYIVILDHAEDLSLASLSDESWLKHYSYAGQFFLIGVILCYYLIVIGRKNETTSSLD